MSNSIIEVNNLSKSYTISHPQGTVDEGRERYTELGSNIKKPETIKTDEQKLVMIR